MTKIYDPHILAILTMLCLVLVPLMYKPSEDEERYTGAAICTALFLVLLYLSAIVVYIFDWRLGYV